MAKKKETKPNHTSAEPKPKKSKVVTGVLIPFDVKNVNGRIYPASTVKRALSKIKKRIKEKRCFGELGFPDNFDTNLSNVSHMIEKVWVRRKNNSLMGKIRVISDLPSGKILSENLDNYVFRPRGAGVVGPDGTVELKEIFSFDAIPKKDDAWVKAPAVKGK